MPGRLVHAVLHGRPSCVRSRGVARIPRSGLGSPGAGHISEVNTAFRKAPLPHDVATRPQFPAMPRWPRDPVLRDTAAPLGGVRRGGAAGMGPARPLRRRPRTRAWRRTWTRRRRWPGPSRRPSMGPAGRARAATRWPPRSREYERIEEVLGRAMSYAQLLFSGDAQDAANGRFYQTMQERVTAIGSHLLFFTLELNRLDDAFARAASWRRRRALARWRPWLRDLRVFRPHQLSDEVEKLLHEKEVTGRSAWNRLFDETMAHMRVPVDGRAGRGADGVGRAEPAVRSRPRRARGGGRGRCRRRSASNIRLFSLITNTLAKDKEIVDGWRNYPRPGIVAQPRQHGRGRGGGRAGRGRGGGFPRLSHRYYAMKAKWLGLEQLKHWDRNAPLPRRRRPDASPGPSRARRRCWTPTPPSRPELAAMGRRLLRQALDRRAAAAGQGLRRLRAPDGAVGASLPAAELPREVARRDDAGPRARPWRAPGAGGQAGLPDVRHAADAGGDGVASSARC